MIASCLPDGTSALFIHHSGRFLVSTSSLRYADSAGDKIKQKSSQKSRTIPAGLIDAAGLGGTFGFDGDMRQEETKSADAGQAAFVLGRPRPGRPHM